MLDFGKMYPIPLGRRIDLSVVGAVAPGGAGALVVGDWAAVELAAVVDVGIPCILSQGLHAGLWPTLDRGYTTPMTPEPR